MTSTLTTSDLPLPDFAAIKTRQQAAWASGDYARIGVTLQIVGETLAEAMDMPAGTSALDVAAGNGNVSLALARRGAAVGAAVVAAAAGRAGARRRRPSRSRVGGRGRPRRSPSPTPRSRRP